MVSTGRLHGFESLEERSLLLALDFTGMVFPAGLSVLLSHWI
jgi:hypothetical protein